MLVELIHFEATSSIVSMYNYIDLLIKNFNSKLVEGKKNLCKMDKEQLN